ncbi:MAG: BREX system ATP-binding protein BrxD [Deltaproteobacteria bacterium]|jgi:hypothetical protein|nr:BREX system ATP-binding protein BrxD [Deltaproteobacteria bacterium]
MTYPDLARVSPVVRDELIDALRCGTVPSRGLDLIAVGVERFSDMLGDELGAVALGGARVKALRGDYGAGKSFVARWFQQRALDANFAVAEIQLGQVETPLYKQDVIYRNLTMALRTRETDRGAFQGLVSDWLLSLEDEAIAQGAKPDDDEALAVAVKGLLSERLDAVSRTLPAYAQVLRALHRAMIDDKPDLIDGLTSWLMAQPNVAVDIKRLAGVTGSLDHASAGPALRGLLTLLRQRGKAGLMLVLDEAETLQRGNEQQRARSYEALRKLIDDIHAGAFPGLYLLVTGTPALFEGPRGIKSLAPLHQRLDVYFGDPAFDNMRAVQVRLQPFDVERLVALGRRVRAVYRCTHPTRVAERVDDAVLRGLAEGVSGALGRARGVMPRLYVRRLIDGIIDRVDQYEGFDPHKELARMGFSPAQIAEAEAEQARGAALALDDIPLDLDAP